MHSVFTVKMTWEEKEVQIRSQRNLQMVETTPESSTVIVFAHVKFKL